MPPHRTTALAGALVLALASPAVHAQSAKQLKREIDELRKQVQALTELTKAQAAAAAQPVTPPVTAQAPAPAPASTFTAAAPEPASTASATPERDQATRDAATPASQADIQGIRADLENYKYEQSRTAERNRASVTRNTRIGGTVQVRGSWFNPAVVAGQANGATGGNTTAVATGRQTSFDVPSVTLSFTGNLYRDYAEGKNLTYQLGFATGSNFAGSPTSTTSATRTLGASSGNGSQFNLTNANLAYSIEPTNGGPEDRKGAITVGQQQVPFGLEAQTTEEIRPVITSAQFTSALSGINTRQIGVIYRGDAFVDVDWTNNYRSALVEYAFGVVNGSGPNKSDNNGKKDWLGRVAFTLPADYNSWWRELKLGVSVYEGYNNLANTTTAGVVRVGKSRRTGFDVNYTHLPYSVAYEYAQGDDDAFTTSAASASEATPTFRKKARGQYINLGYTWGEQFLTSEKSLAKYDDYWPKSYQAFVRHDVFDNDTRSTVTGDKTRITTIGLNAFFAETTKLQANYLQQKNDHGAAGPSADRPAKQHGLQLQFQYGF